MSTDKFSNADVFQVQSSVLSLLGDVGVDPTGPEMIQYINDDTSAVNTIKQQTATQSLMVAGDELETQHKRDTDLLAQVNEAWNANRHLHDIISSEKSRVDKVDRDTKRDLYSTYQSYMMSHYQTNYYGTMIKILMFSAFMIMLLLLPLAYWKNSSLSTTALCLIDGVLLALYLVIMVLIFQDIGHRRTTDWNKYYWRTKHRPQQFADSGGECDAATSVQESTQ